jgi:hypothetical protein
MNFYNYINEILNYAQIKGYQKLLLFLWPFLALIATFIVGANHDYISYQLHWDQIAQGGDAWLGFPSNQLNAYGPVHLLFAPLYALHPLLPKMVFVLFWLLSSFFIINWGFKNKTGPQKLKRTIYFLLIFPFLWRMTVDRGFNDIVIAVSILMSIHFKHKSDFKSSTFLALGVLLKLIPLVILPFFILEYRTGRTFLKRFEINWRYLFYFIGWILLAYGISYFIWGEQVLEPFTYMNDRYSKQLSIFRFLRGDFSPLHLFMDNPDLDRWSVYATAISLIFYFVYTKIIKNQYQNQNLILGALVITFSLFKVGHIQFFTCIFFIVPYMYITYDFSNKIYKSLKYYLIWLTLYDIFYSISGGYYHTPFHRVREFAGLIHFVLSLFVIIMIIKDKRTLEE